MSKKGWRRLGRIVLGLFILLNLMVAFNAWKTTHFYNDPSLRGPQPKSTWTTINNIVFGAQIPKRINDSVPSVPYDKVILTTRDGIKLEAWEINTDKAFPSHILDSSHILPHRPTVILFHGLGSCKSAILNEAYSFLHMGYDVFLVDFRAHGGSTGNETTIGVREAEDVRSAYDFIKRQTGQEPVLWGISLGAATITSAIYQFNLHPSKIILEMPFGSMYNAVKGKLHIMGLPSQPIAPLLMFWGSVLNGIWAFGNNPTTFAKQITCPTLIQWGANDPRVTRAEEDKILANINTTNKQLVVYETCKHESLCTKEPVKWKTIVQQFLNGN